MPGVACSNQVGSTTTGCSAKVACGIRDAEVVRSSRITQTFSVIIRFSERKEEVLILVPVVNMKVTGQNITALRNQRGISVRDLQQMLGFSTPQSIYKWQRGETLPTIENLVALSCILAVPMDEILAAECRLSAG